MKTHSERVNLAKVQSSGLFPMGGGLPRVTLRSTAVMQVLSSGQRCFLTKLIQTKPNLLDFIWVRLVSAKKRLLEFCIIF